MQRTWLALTCLALGLCIPSLFAAEKARDWQTGQVVESKAPNDPRIHAIAGPDKTYVVRGSIGGAEDALAVGATVRFAVQGTNLFLSIEGSEYRLSVLGATVKTAPATPAASAAAPLPTAPAPPAPPPPTAPAPPAPPPPPPAAPASKSAPAPPAAAVNQPPAKASQPAPEPASGGALDNALDNDAIVKMIVGGLKADTVVSVIEALPGKYSLTSDALAGLKAAGVPQRVIAAMSAKMAQH